MNILFWNTDLKKNGSDEREDDRKLNIDKCIEYFINNRECDIVILAEYPYDLNHLCNKISVSGNSFKVGKKVNEKCRVEIMYRSKYPLELLADDRYYFINNIRTASGELAIAGVHLPSKREATLEDQKAVVSYLVNDLQDVKERVDHNRFIITGDFNEDPFEINMISSVGFHSIAIADIVQKKKERNVYYRENEIFYNPMWNFLGDFNKPLGTCYYDKGGAVNLYWYIYDQVLLSADILQCFDKDSLEIVTECGGKRLLSEKGLPDRKNYSDHLPVLFHIKESEL